MRPSPPAQAGAATLDPTITTVVEPRRCADCGRPDHVFILHDGQPLCGPCSRPFGVETIRSRRLVGALAQRHAAEITTEMRREPRRGLSARQLETIANNLSKALVRS